MTDPSTRGVPTLHYLFEPSTKISLWENFYFMRIDDGLYAEAEALSERISQISRGRRTLILTDNSEIVGKLGEFVAREFCRHYLDGPWESMVCDVNAHGGDRCDLQIHGHSVDVKTRNLYEDMTVAAGFDLRIPHNEKHPPRHQDIYVLAGYCAATRYGYMLGWCTYDELIARPVRMDIKYPARCLPLADMHPMMCLGKYLAS